MSYFSKKVAISVMLSFTLILAITSAVQAAPPNAPAISAIGGKSVVVGQTLYTNAGQQGSSSVNLLIEGFSEAGSTITIFNGTSQLSTTAAVVAQGDGSWEGTVVLSQGNYTLSAKATNADGTSPTSDPAIATNLDTTAPSVSVRLTQRWVSNATYFNSYELESIYANVSDSSSGLDFSTVTGTIIDASDGNAPIDITVSPDYDSRIDLIPTAGFGDAPNDGPFIHMHTYKSTVTISDKAGNVGTYTKTMYADFEYGITVTGMYVYDPAHQSALNAGELGIGEPTNNTPTTASSPLISPSGENYGAGWVKYYKNMYIYTNPTNMIIKLDPGDVSPWQGGYNITRIWEYINSATTVQSPYLHPNNNAAATYDSNDGWFVSKSDHLKPKGYIRHYFSPRDSAYNRVTHNFYYTTKIGSPAAPSLTDTGAPTPTTKFNITDPRIIPGTAGEIDKSINNMIVYRYLNTMDLKWKVVVLPEGQTYSNTTGVYDHGDTWKDLNNNWQYDAGEPFADYTKSPATSDGETFHLVNPNNDTLELSQVHTSYHKVYDSVAQLLGPYNNIPHRIYKVDLDYPTIDDVAVTPAYEESLTLLYVAHDSLPNIEVNIDDRPFYTYEYVTYTFEFDQCKIELLNSSGSTIYTSPTDTFYKPNPNVSTGTGSVDLASEIGSLSEGEYTLKLTITDNFLNAMTDDTRKIRVDGSAPSVTSINPAPGSQISSLPNFQVTLYDATIGSLDGSGISFGTGDQAIYDPSYSHLVPFKIVAEENASGQTISLTRPLLDHQGNDIAVIGQQFVVFEEGQSETVDTVEVTSVNATEAVLTSVGGNLSNGTLYRVLYEIPYYHASNGIDTLSANPISPITQDGYYLVQVRAVDKVGNTSITTSHYQFGTGDPSFFTNATGIITLTPSPQVCRAGETVEVTSSIILTQNGDPVFDGSLVTVASTFGNITDADQDQFSLGIQIGTVGGVATFHVTSTTLGSGTVSAQIGDAYSSPNPVIEFIPNYPSGTFVLQTDRTSLTADGAGLVSITSNVIMDAFSNIITTDNTPDNLFTVTVPGFTILTPDANSTLAGHQVKPDSNGQMAVSIQAGTITQQTTLQITSVDVPSYSDTINLTLTPGVPGQPIVLTTTKDTLIAQKSGENTLITSETIKDINGNTVADGTLITVSTTIGSITSTDESGSHGGIQRAAQNGVITLQVSAQTASVGDAAVNASSVEGGQTGSLTLHFVADDPYGTITLTSTPSELVADESSTAVITSTTVQDQYGNSVGSGLVFNVTTTEGQIRAGSGDSWSDEPITVTTSGESTISFQLKSSLVLGDADISAQSQQGTAQGTVSVPFIAGLPTDIIVLTPDKSELIAGSGDTVTVTGTVYDGFGHTVADGTLVTVTASSGTITTADASGTEPGLQVSTLNGVISIIISASSASTGVCNVSVQSVENDAAGSTSFDFIPGAPTQSFTLTASPSSILADGTSISQITSSVLYDTFGNVVAEGELVTIEADLGSITTADADLSANGIQVPVDGSGQITFILQSCTTADTSQVTAQSVNGSATGSTSVVFYPDLPSGTITLTADPSELFANSGETSQIVSSVITDTNGNTVPDGTLVTVQTTSGEITTADEDPVTTGIQLAVSNGIVQCVLSSVMGSGDPVPVGDSTVTMESVTGSATGSTIVSFKHDDPYGTITMTALSAPLVADGVSETVIQSDPILDRYDNSVSADMLVTISTTEGSILEDDADDVVGNQVTTDNDGKISFTLRSGTTSATATVTALSYTGTAQGQLSVVINPDTPFGTINLTASPSLLILDGSSESTITSDPITDSNGNVVSDGTLITVASDNGTITTTDGDGGTTGIQVSTLNGIIEFVLSSQSALLSDATITASSVAGSASGSTTVSFIPGPPSGAITLAPSPASIVADPYGLAPVAGITTTSTITSGLILDGAGNPVSAGELFTVYISRGEIISADASSSVSGVQIAASAGVITFDISSTGGSVGTATVYASSVNGSALGSTNVAFTDTSIIADITIILDLDRPNADRYVPWDNTRAVYAKCYDELGNPASGDTLTLVMTQNESGAVLSDYAGYPGSGTTSQRTVTTDTSGTAIISYTTPVDPGDDIDRTDIIDAYSAQVAQTLVDDRRLIVTSSVPPLFRISSVASQGIAGEYIPVVIEVIDLYDSHITDVTTQFPSLQVSCYGVIKDTVQTTGIFYQYNDQTTQYEVLTDPDSLDWDVNGYATLYYRNETASIVTLNIEDDSDVIKPVSKDIEIVPSAVASGFQLTALPSSITANGTSLSSITSTAVTDAFGNITEGAVFTVSATQGTIVALDTDGNSGNGIQILTDADGYLSFEVRSETVVDTSTVTAQEIVTLESASTNVDFIPGLPSETITLTPDQSSILADGSSSVHIESSVIHDSWGNIVAVGSLITVDTSQGSIITADADNGIPDVQIAVDANGKIDFDVESSLLAGTATITAVSVEGTSSGSTTVVFIQGDPVGTIVLTPSPAQVVANAPNSSLVTSDPITDGTNVIADGQLFTVSASRGTIVALDEDNGLAGIQVASSGGVISFVYNPNTGMGTVTVSAQSVLGSASGSAQIELIGAGKPDGPIVLNASPSNILADGVSESTVTSQPMTDRYGNVIQAGTFFNVSVSDGTINATGQSSTQVASIAGGILSFTVLSSTTAGDALVTAQATNSSSTGSVTVTFEPGVGYGTITMTALPSSLIAKSGSISTISIPAANPIRDVYNNIVADGIQVTVSTNLGKLLDNLTEVDQLTVTTTNGLFSVQLKATNGPGTAVISAQTVVGSASGTINVDLTPDVPTGTITLTPSPSAIVADGTTTSTITSSVITDQYNTQVSAGTPVTVSASSGTILDADAHTAPGIQVLVSAGGTISFTLQSSTTAETASVDVQSVTGSASGSTSVEFIPGLPSGTITLTALPAELIARSDQTSAVQSAIIADANGNPVETGTEVTVASTLGLILTADANGSEPGIQVLTDASGKITFTLQADGASPVGTAQLSAESVEGNAVTSVAETVVFKVDVPAGTITLTPSPTQIIADGSTISTITSNPITDIYGNTMPEGTLVTVTSTWGTINETDADEINYPQIQVETNASGIITFSITSEISVGTATINATTTEGTASGSTSVEGVAGQATSLVIVLPGETFSPSEPDGKTGTPVDQEINVPFQVKVYALDANSNPALSSTMEIELDTLSTYTQSTPSFVQSFDSVSGELVFSVEDTIAGQNLQLSVHDTATQLITSSSSEFDILAGDPVKLQIILPGQTAVPGDSGTGLQGSPIAQDAGVAFQVIVNYVDQYYNRVTDVTETVKLTSSGTNAVMPPNTVLTDGQVVLTVIENTQTDAILRRLTASLLGHESDPIFVVCDSFEVLDTLPPTVSSFVINSGAEYTLNQEVILNIEAIDHAGSAIEMQFRNEDQTWAQASAYEPYQTEKTGYMLSSGLGAKTVFVRVRDANGFESGEFSDTIYYGSTPTADAGGLYSSVEGTDFTVSGSASNDPAGLSLTYEWDLDDDGEFDDHTGESFTYSFAENGVYQIALKVTNEYNQSDTDQATVTIQNAAPIVDAGSDINSDEGEEVALSGSFTDLGTNDTHTYSWDFGDGSDPVTDTLSPSYTYVDNGIYTATLTVTDDDGDSSQDHITVTVTNLAPVVEAGNNITADGGDTCSFSGSYTDAGVNDTHTYSWDFGDGSTPVTDTLSPTHVYADNDTYTVTLTVTDNNGDSASDTLIATILNVAPVLTVDSDFEINEGETIELTSTTYTDPETGDTHTAKIIWGDGDTAEFPVTGGQISASHRYMYYGNYFVSVEITDDDGASDLKTLEVRVYRDSIDVSIKTEDDLSATIMFTAIGGKEYEIYYSDDDFATFGSSFNWTLADTVLVDSQESAGSYNDNGDPDHPGVDGLDGTADDGRLAPYQVDTRYYRVVEAGTVDAGDPLSSEDVLFYHTKQLYEGRNYIAQIGVQTNQSLGSILDSRFLPGGLSMQNSTIVSFWQNDQMKNGYVLDWQGDTSWSDGTYDITDEPVDEGKGMIVFIKSGNGTIVLPMVGTVRMTDNVDIDLEQGGYALVTWPYADKIELDNCGLIESGFTSGFTARTSDQIYFWNPVTQKYDMPVFYFATSGEWRNYDHTPCTRKLKPGESILIKLNASSSCSTWTTQRKYIKSKRNFEF